MLFVLLSEGDDCSIEAAIVATGRLLLPDVLLAESILFRLFSIMLFT